MKTNNKSRSTVETENYRMSISDLISIHEGAISYFDKLHKRGAENERYYSADPFDDKQKAEYALQDRIPFSLSAIPQKLNSIIASESKQRITWKCKAKVSPEDLQLDQDQQNKLFEKEIKAKLATLRMRMIEQSNSGRYKFSDIFASGVGVIYGAVKVFVDTNKYGDKEIFLSDVDYKNLIWDVNSVDYEHNEVAWIAEKDYQYRIDLKRKYPNKNIDQLAIGDAASRWGRKKTQYFVNYNRSGNSDLDLLTKIIHYHKVDREYHVALFGNDILCVERNKSEAERILKEKMLPYFGSGKDLPPVDIVPITLPKYDKYVFTYTDILEYEETDLDMHPYSIYQAFQFKNKIWTMTDILKSMQQFANRLLAQIDFAFGTDLKNVYQLNMDVLEAVGLSKEEAITMLKEKGIVLGQGGMKVFDPIPSQGANPQWIQVMELMMRFIDESSGGSPMGGTPSGSNQSAKAINALIMQGQLLTDKFIDNLHRFYNDLGKKVLWFMKKYDNAPYIMRVEGGALSMQMLQLLKQNGIFSPSIENPNAGYLSLNQDYTNYLETSDYDIEITEESMTENKKELEFGVMIKIEESHPEYKMSKTWNELLLERLPNISFEDRYKIIQEVEQAKQAQAQQAQQQAGQAQQFQQQKLNTDKAKVLSNTLK